jgi:hypothetical protein
LVVLEKKLGFCQNNCSRPDPNALHKEGQTLSTRIGEKKAVMDRDLHDLQKSAEKKPSTRGVVLGIFYNKIS